MEDDFVSIVEKELLVKLISCMRIDLKERSYKNHDYYAHILRIIRSGIDYLVSKVLFYW